jgi:anti-sigma factor RsiW
VAKTIVEIECAEVWRQISNYLDGEVDPPLRASMSSHFKDCAHCSAVLDGARNVVKLVGDGRAFEIPAGASQRFYKKLNDHLASRQCARG